MKTAELLHSYLLANKKMSFQGLGYFTLTGNYNPGPDDPGGFPSGTVQFTTDKSSPEDIALVVHIARETGKIKPLAAADLESFLLQGKQLLNISKPFLVEGLGILQKNAVNEIEFIPLTEEDVQPDKDRKKREEHSEAIRFDDNYLKPARRNGNQSRKMAQAMLAMIGLGLIGWVGYFAYHHGKQKTGENSLEKQNQSLSQTPLNTTPDTTSTMLKQEEIPDTMSHFSTAQGPFDAAKTKNPEEFNVVIEASGKNRAMKRYADLREWGHKVIVYTSDSVTFKIAFPIKAPLADSIRYRDSLSHFFGRKVWIEKK